MPNTSKNTHLLKKTITIVRDSFWNKNIDILVRYDRMTEFIPTNDMTLEEKLNSITRLSIYLSAILTAYTNNTKYLYFFIMTLLLTHLIYVNMSDKLLDIFNKNITQRQFYTMPVTTIPNEQTKFANWLYATPPTCKEGNGDQCVKYNLEFLKDSKIRNGIF